MTMPKVELVERPKLLNESETLTRTHWAILFFCLIGWLFDFYDLILYTFLVDPILADFGIAGNMLQGAAMLASSLVATAIGGISFGIISDRMGRKKALQWTIIIFSLGTFLSGLAPNVLFLVGALLITGFGVGGQWAVGQTMIGETWPAKWRGKAGAFMQTGVPIGVALAAIMGGFVTPIVGWRMTFFISAAAALIVIPIRGMMPESDLWLRNQELFEKGEIPDELKEKLGRSEISLLFDKKIRKAVFLGLMLAAFDMFAYWILFSWLPKYLKENLSLGLQLSGIWMVITQVGAFIGYISFGYLSDLLGRRPAFTIFMLLQAASVAALTIFANWISSASSFGVELLLIPLFLMGIGTGAFSGYGPLFAEIFPTRLRNTAAGFCFNVARGASAIAPILVALVAQDLGFGLAGGLALAIIFDIAVALWIWLFPETKGKELNVCEYL